MRTLIPALLLLASCAAPASPEPESRFDRRISFNLQRASLRETVNLISRESGLNIVFDARIDGTLTMSANELPAGEVLDAVAATFGCKVARLKGDTARVYTP